ncbi:stage V sporulation protein AD [Alkalibaculum sp. M08DMB]|uniref:Stage V sporulation protein AD n=1 Tax=Alkalibaculum sporogenes TaxID=2655001 RepID=A0A6A7KA73_9FIRM|nr:stage V sporulation protein AD [Alkalibaculum sporogenes]MPW26334.1 stage V sporulation protein AD [Alkalibaculum sporogenes]
MKNNRLGRQTIRFENPPTILNTASIVGPKEGEGPLRDYFDKVECDDTCKEKTFEKAEEYFCNESVETLLHKERLKSGDIDYYIGGDLLNQIISTSFTAKKLGIPYFGVYSACATFAEAIQLASCIIAGEFALNIVVSASSHFSSAERQYRSPLESGVQRKMTAQWTVTGAGSMLLTQNSKPPYITHVTTGIVQDYGIKEADNMGTAMAPAAVETILSHFKDTGYKPDDYDLIITGDLGTVGKDITMDLLLREGFDVSKNYTDCGVEIYDESQDTHARGSGAGCSAVVFSGYLFDQLNKKELNKILFVPTGALLSPTTTLQGDTIPCIAHAITIENTPELGKEAK